MTKTELSKLLEIPLSPSKKDFKNLAKERGFRGFQNLTKDKLSKLLEPPAPNIIDRKNPSINIPILQPKKVVVKENQAPTFIEKTVETFSDWMNWLAESGKKYIAKPVSEALKNFKEKINAIFQTPKEFDVKEGESALKNFVREKIIEGKPGYEPQSFFEAVKNIILKILKENTSTKVKMILACKMEKTDLKSGNTINIDTTFHSEIEVNLKVTEEEIFDKMVARIEEIISKFKNNGSNWVFDRIIQLEIHFANWVPIKGSSYVPLPEKIAAKKAVINLKNEDEECFKW